MPNTFTNVAGLQVTSEINQANYLSILIDFETGQLDDETTIKFFQYLIDTGLAWQLQGFYGRTAKDLIASGYCFRADDLNRPGVIDGVATDPNPELPANL